MGQYDYSNILWTLCSKISLYHLENYIKFIFFLLREGQRISCDGGRMIRGTALSCSHHIPYSPKQNTIMQAFSALLLCDYTKGRHCFFTVKMWNMLLPVVNQSSVLFFF